MDEQTKTFCVRDFGNDREYDDAGELMAGLRENYAGRSVAVHIRTPRHRMLHAMFIDVSDEGVLLETYPHEGRTRVTKEVFEAVA